jgi:hypothetical protein
VQAAGPLDGTAVARVCRSQRLHHRKSGSLAARPAWRILSQRAPSKARGPRFPKRAVVGRASGSPSLRPATRAPLASAPFGAEASRPWGARKAPTAFSPRRRSLLPRVVINPAALVSRITPVVSGCVIVISAWSAANVAAIFII